MNGSVTLLLHGVGSILAERTLLRSTRSTTRPLETPYYTAKEAAAYLRISYGTFRNWATRIPRRRTGRYHRDDLDKFTRTR